MSKNLAFNFFLFVMLVSMQSCSESAFTSLSEANKWLNNIDHGCKKNKSIAGVDYSVMYVPSEYFLFKDREVLERGSDSSTYANALYFILTIKDEAIKNKPNTDVNFREISKADQYTNRIYDLNFDLSSSIVLVNGTNRTNPKLAVVENTYGVKNSESFIVCFDNSIDRIRQEKITIEFNDEIFNSGLLNFTFRKNDLLRFPGFKEKQL